MFPPPVDESYGLCGSCRYRREVRSVRGSVYLLCRRSETDPQYPKYPPLPLTRCPGFEGEADRTRDARDVNDEAM